jgi:hypothetical protein
MEPNPNDPVIDEIREIRHRISERCNHDPAQLVAYYMKLQERHRDRLLEPPGPAKRPDPSSA